MKLKKEDERGSERERGREWKKKEDKERENKKQSDENLKRQAGAELCQAHIKLG